MKTINFFSACTNLIRPPNPSSSAKDMHYEDFIIPFLFFSLYSSPNASAEILTGRRGFIKENQDALDELVKTMGYRFKIRGDELRQSADVSRFLVEPLTRADYTYISDIDILITEEGIENYYEEIFKEIDLPYSNVQRKGHSLLTGTFCADTKRYYRKEMKENMGIYIEKNLRGVRDESVLYDIMFSAHPLPTKEMNDNVERYRPIHGIHTSLSRNPRAPKYQPNAPTWDMTPEKVKRFEKISKSEEYKKIYPHFTERYKNILNEIYL